MDLNSNNWSLLLDLNGGRIKELFYKGIKVFGTYQRLDGKVGNTHLCIPSFDKEGQERYNLPFHGLVRNTQWSVTKKSKNSITIHCTTPFSSFYSAHLSIEQEFNLEKYFIHTIHVVHIEGREVPLNIGCHYYWDTPKGWKQSLLNNQQLANHIVTNGCMKLKQENVIVFPHAQYKLTSSGFHSAVLWTSFKHNTEGNKLFNNDFCCIEPVIGWPGYFDTKESMLKMGETKVVSISLVPQEGLEPPSL